MKILLLEGREFGQSDTTNTPLVAVINQTAARRFWPGQSAIGRRVIVRHPPDDQARVVVGVVKDSKYRRLTEEVRPAAVFIPFFQRYVPARPLQQSAFALTGGACEWLGVSRSSYAVSLLWHRRRKLIRLPLPSRPFQPPTTL